MCVHHLPKECYCISPPLKNSNLEFGAYLHARAAVVSVTPSSEGPDLDSLSQLNDEQMPDCL